MTVKVKLILNPMANLGRARAAATELEQIVSGIGGADWITSKHPKHAFELARQAAAEGYGTVVAMGGDGTMHEVLNGLMSVPAAQRPKLGMVPLGSGNDFAFACGISAKPEEAIRQALTGAPRAVDIGYLLAENSTKEFWANAIGIGFDTIVTLHSRKVPIVQGFAVYLIAVLQTILFDYKPFHLSMKVDDVPSNHDYLMLVLMNGKREGGGFHVTPDSRPDDGHLDYLAINRISRLKMLRILPEVMNGTHGRMLDCNLGTFKTFELVSRQPLFIHLDGEIFSTPETKPVTTLSAGILPEAIQVVC